jgi:hypothetical protein
MHDAREMGCGGTPSQCMSAPPASTEAGPPGLAQVGAGATPNAPPSGVGVEVLDEHAATTERPNGTNRTLGKTT